MKNATIPSSTEQSPVLILSCSARAGGNSDYAAELVKQAVAASGPAQARLVHIRDRRISPCISCGNCLLSRRPCPLVKNDDSERLFADILAAGSIYIVSPIYFYHLPGILKIFIDRAQFYYGLYEQGEAELCERPWRDFQAILISGRQKGEKLFDGSILTLEFFMKVFHFRALPPLLLRGFDARNALAADAQARSRIMRQVAGCC